MANKNQGAEPRRQRVVRKRRSPHQSARRVRAQTTLQAAVPTQTTLVPLTTDCGGLHVPRIADVRALVDFYVAIWKPTNLRLRYSKANLDAAFKGAAADALRAIDRHFQVGSS